MGHMHRTGMTMHAIRLLVVLAGYNLEIAWACGAIKRTYTKGNCLDVYDALHMNGTRYRSKQVCRSLN